MTRPHTPNKIYDIQWIDVGAAVVGMFTLGFVIGALIWSGQ